MADKIQLRRDTTANWTSENPTLANGEPAWDTTEDRLKIGDGATAWTSLDYATGGASGGDVYLDNNNLFTKAQKGEIQEITYGSTITTNFDASNRFHCTLTGDVTVANPSNNDSAMGGVIYLEQDGTGGHTISWGTYWKPPTTITADTGANKINIFAFEGYSATQIILTHIGSI